MSRRGAVIPFAVAALAIAIGCQQKEPPPPELTGALEVLGSSTLVPFAETGAKKLHAVHPGLEVSVTSATDSHAFGSTRNGLVGIGLVTGPVPPELTELKTFKIGRDGLCLVVNAKNPVTALSDEQVNGIFTKKITNWKELGGDDREIRPLNAADPRATLLMFMNYLKVERLDLRGDSFQSADRHAFETVGEFPEAIAYISIGGTLTAAKSGQPLKCIGFRGVEPTPASVASGSYPLAYDLTIVTKGEPKPAAKAFVDWALSKDGQDLLKSQGFVPVSGGA